MSKYLGRINDILKHANSKKVTDKKKFVLELLELYECTEAIQEICKGTETNEQNVTNWSHILHVVHKILLNEADRLVYKDVHSRAIVSERQNTCILVQKTFQHANTYKVPLLKCDDAMPLILQILRSSSYEYYHDTYLNVLISYILPFRIYQVNMLSEHWKELLKICIKLYKNISSITSKKAILNTLEMCIEHGCFHSNLAINVNDILKFLVNVFIDARVNEEILAESTYKLTNIVCLQVAIEYRSILCQFSEDIAPAIISLKSSVEKYKLLLFFVCIHHPTGSCKFDDGAYAHNWTKWCAILKDIHLMILKDIKTNILSPNFIYLATEVFRQIFENPDLIFEEKSFEECDSVQHVKRRRIIIKANSPFNMLINNNAEEAWPIVQILTALLKKYPECLKPKEFLPFMKIILDFLTLSCTTLAENITDSFYELVAVLMTNETIYPVTDIENSNMYWDQIWDILLRSLKVNQNEISCHKLTQLFIMNNKISNPHELLKLYVLNLIKWSIISVRTLILFFEHFQFPADVAAVNANFQSGTVVSNSDRLCLIKWILNIPWCKMGTQIVVDEVCLLLIYAILKSKSRRKFKFTEFNASTRCDCLADERNVITFHEHIEHCYMLLKYKKSLLGNVKREDVKQEVKINEGILFERDILSYLMNSLCDITHENKNEDLHIRIVKIAIIAKVISMMKQLCIIPEDIDDIPLIHSMKNQLNIVYTLLENTNLSRSKYAYLYQLTKALNILYETSYDTAVTKIIVTSATSDMLKNIFSLMNIEDNDIVDYETINNYFDYDFIQSRCKNLDKDIGPKRQCDFCNKGTIRISVTKALTLFCCAYVGKKKCEIQIILMNNLLKIDMYDLSHTVDFKMAITVLSHLSKYSEEELWENYNERPVQNLVKLYHKCLKDETALRYIFSVLPYFLKYATKYKCKLSRLMNIISQCHKHWSERKYGFAAEVGFIKSLFKIIFINPSDIYHIRDALDEIPIIEKIVSSFNNSSFTVQLQIMNGINRIYCSKIICSKIKERLFQTITKSQFNVLMEDGTDGNAKLDQKEVITAGNLLLLANILSANATFQSSALLAMLQFVIDKKLNIEIISKAINVMPNEVKYINLVKDNLTYLMTYWFNSKYSMQPFPWKLMEYELEEHFNKMHLNELAFIVFQNLDLSQLVSFCNHMKLSVEEIIENIFPQIMTWILYCINGKNGNISKERAKKIFHKLILNEDEFSAITKFSNLFDNKFLELLIYLIGRLHDEDDLERISNVRISFAMSDPPHFKEETINMCLKYMEENLLKQRMPIQYVLASTYPDALQKLLLHFYENIYKKEFEEHCIKAFHQYIYLCTLIVEKLKCEYFNSLAMYVIKDIGYSLLHIIKMYDGTLRNFACKYLFKFIKDILPERSVQFKEIMNFLVTTLTSIGQIEETPIVLEIIKFLIIDQQEILSDVIEKLNAFPKISFLQGTRDDIHNEMIYKTQTTYSLEKEVQHFLNIVNDKDIHCSVEDVVHLQIQLSSRKEELQQLFNKLETFCGFTEDCASSMLHKLVYKLIKLMASPDVDISVQAAKCLGELGPVDLTSAILYFQKNHIKESSDLIEILTLKIVITMVQFLFHNDLNFRKSSANALYTIFSSLWGQKLLNTKYMTHLRTILQDAQTIVPLHYIQPFIARKSLKGNDIDINYVKVNSIVNPTNTIWTLQSNDTYINWIVVVTCNIAECFTGLYFKNLIPICVLSTDFCETVLPRMIFLIIHINKKFTSEISKCLNVFFEYHFSELHKTTNCDHRIIRSVLNIVNYIRTQDSSNLLHMNYMCLAKAAQYCSAYCTAILYAEMFCDSLLSDYTNFDNVSKIDYIYELSPLQGKVIQHILRDSYTKIGDPDAIHGTGSSHLEDHITRIQHGVHAKEWNRVMLAQDLQLSFGNMAVVREMANGLHQSGLQYLLNNFMSIIAQNNEQVDKDIQYESAWRLSDWNFAETNHALCTQNNCNSKPDITEHDYHFHHYQALKYFHEKNVAGVENAIKMARISIIRAFKNVDLESSTIIYEQLMQLQLIREIEDLNNSRQDEYETALHKWEKQSISNFNEFEYIEPILTQRTIMFQINNTLSNNVNIKNALHNTYLQISKIAVEKGNIHIAMRSLAVLAKQKDLPVSIQDKLLYQESLLAKHRNDLEVGRFLLRKLMSKENLDANLRAQTLRVYADWMAETKSENPQTIIKQYYLKSLDISSSVTAETITSMKNLHDTQVALARFADSQYEQISSYMKSPQFESLKEYITSSHKGFNTHSVTEDVDIKSALILNQRQNTNDVAELQYTQNEREYYLILALKYYSVVLQHSNTYNLLIFRIIALWFDNMHHKDVNDLLQQNFKNIPSFKFIPLIPQLAAHINDEFNEFSKIIYDIIKRCALEHPHHTLPSLLALKNLYGDYDYNPSKTCKSPEPRVLGAQKLLQELMDSNISTIIQEMEKLSHALVMLANLTTSSTKLGNIIKIPRNQEIINVKNFINISVPTLTVVLKPSQNYNDVVGITKYVPSYEIVGGVNTPKKLICIGTDGKHRHQLIKGKDDLRQDAVMQQVFNVMNTLLRTCSETNRRKLHIRTYKVVPLTQRSGILEWCDNTIPIITVLIGSNRASGLHRKYYPKDYTANTCIEKLASVGRSSTDIKLKVFMDCCTHMHPVMHYFFIEKYASPEAWFERRLAYTRSIATTSMAGYILGIGDRHLSNILIDQTTAEVIHIDFGIAFDQAKVLPVPETIPFRLTRNIEVAMGVSGVEGTMRHSCEKTLTVLREQKQIIITLLQVLLYDPLYRWSITPAKAHNVQNETSLKLPDTKQCFTATNKTAERALLRIEQKLQGTEERLVSSVAGQVEKLIQQARDPRNLCRLYFGWQPYL